MPLPDLLDVSSVAAILGLSPRRVAQLREIGFPAVLVGGGDKRARYLYPREAAVAWLAAYRDRCDQKLQERKAKTKLRHRRSCRDCGVSIGPNARSCRPCALARIRASRVRAHARTPYTKRNSTPSWVAGAVADYHAGVGVPEIAVRVCASEPTVNVYLRNAGADRATHLASVRKNRAASPECVAARAAFESGAPALDVCRAMGLKSANAMMRSAALFGWDREKRRASILALQRARRGGLTVKEYQKAQSRGRRHRRRQLHKKLPPPVVSGYCSYCLAPLVPGTATIDHVTPLAHGGAHHIDNIVPACATCNSSKQDSDLLSWLVWKSRAA